MRVVEILGTMIDLTEAIKDYSQKKLDSIAKMTEKFTPCDVRIDVGKTVSGQNKGKIYRAEYNLTIPGAVLRAEAVEEDLYAAIDTATDDLKRQVIKYKEKMQDADRMPAEEI
ncbi:MAG: ribosome-associated translation inhibitor RaiA [Patescibacteria group bacterium]|jgi:putative sigma-54 modulation protein